MSHEFEDAKIAVNGLWPRTAVATSAVKNVLGPKQKYNKIKVVA